MVPNKNGLMENVKAFFSGLGFVTCLGLVGGAFVIVMGAFFLFLKLSLELLGVL